MCVRFNKFTVELHEPSTSSSSSISIHQLTHTKLNLNIIDKFEVGSFKK